MSSFLSSMITQRTSMSIPPDSKIKSI
jgi:hypothetical protein